MDRSNDGAPRRKLSDILNGGNSSNAADALRDQWDSTEAAGDFGALPAGTYTCRAVAGELTTNRWDTPRYSLAFRVIEGDYAKRQVWLDLYLTEAALPMTKRDLAKLGVRSIDQLEQPLPPGIRCAVKVATRVGDDGEERNRVRSFEAIGIDKDPTADDDFAPDAPTAEAAAPVAETPDTTDAPAADATDTPDTPDAPAGGEGES